MVLAFLESVEFVSALLKQKLLIFWVGEGESYMFGCCSCLVRMKI
jgi:hypothetical protein